MSLTVDLQPSSESLDSHTTRAQCHPPSGISVLVVGGGPAGVYAALECWRKEHHVSIVERNPVARTQGDFFNTTPHVIEHIRTNWPELGEEKERIAEGSWVSYHRVNGQLMSGPEPFDWKKAGIEDDGSPAPARMYRHNRPKFLGMLISQLERLGIRNEYGCRVVDCCENAQKAGIVLDDNRRLEADVVVAADGIGSKSHRLVNGQEIRARGSGLAGPRAAFPVQAICDDEELNKHFGILDSRHPHFQMWIRPGVHMSMLRTNDINNGAATESWNESADADSAFQYVSAVKNFSDFERVSCCQKVGFINQARRDTRDVELDPSMIKSEHGRWMWRHDPESYPYNNYSRALDHLQNGAPFQNTNTPPGHTHEPWSVDHLMGRVEQGLPVEFDGGWS
ncbi:hypothetical protein JX266_013670 [Neoarthrinium moseri]|uniref:uncharacterized protein n=1 Tax=Neoarthrinium moseri TaxID=1658444 RepID=UPI001FDB4C42|nr:uncharacterized protein JN550_009703 [Neoarthrinium moseri]KAI1840127.1 hypothetical protein JX266_013670 [Neoarthrinium moseri]KAI1863177.1 hypothetical protein JN550_009703 [Neoarthrinium moseri]